MGFSDVYKSNYYSNTYVPAVDLSEKALSKHLLKNENQEIAAIAERLISQPEVQKVLSEPLTYIPEEFQLKNAILEKHGFTLLSKKLDLQKGTINPFYSVIEHQDLPNWVIKSGAARVPKDQFLLGPMNDRNEMTLFTQEESLLRIAMADRIQKVAKKANIDAIVPKKALVAYTNADKVTDPTKKYCVVCEKIDILSVEDTIKAIKEMEGNQQRELAKKIATIVEKAGLVDASLNNIRLTPQGKIAIIDTEPGGLMVKKGTKKNASVEKCARIGLFTLMQSTGKNPSLIPTNAPEAQEGLEAFHNEVKRNYDRVVKPKLSAWKITLSVLSLGLIPLINVIRSIAKIILITKTQSKGQALDADFKYNSTRYIEEKVPDTFVLQSILSSQEDKERVQRELQQATEELQNEDFVKEYAKKRLPLNIKILTYTNGIPFRTRVAHQF